MPELPSINPPRISEILKGAKAVRGVVQDVREVIHDGRQEIRDIANAFKLDEKGETVVTKKAPPSPPSQETAPPAADGVTDAETLQYQRNELADELALLEKHLASGGKIAGKSCDCLAKHSRVVKRLATETVPIAARQGKDPSFYSNLAEWANEIQQIGTKEAVDSGQYTNRYAQESGNASNLRKSIESGADCPTCPQRLTDFQATHKPSLEEAKQLANTEAVAVEEGQEE
jgi:hypothetical protein